MSAPIDQPATYRITVIGRIDERWRDWFNGLVFSHSTAINGRHLTTMSGQLPDQAALRGLLIRIWDLGLIVSSVERLTGDGVLGG